MNKRFLFISVLIISLSLMNSYDAFSSEKKNIAFVARTVTSMEKIFKNTMKEEWKRADIGDEISISACRGESESFQIVIVPHKELHNLKWQVTSKIENKNINIHPVGYVYVSKPLKPSFIKNYPEKKLEPDWWPDPIFSTWEKIEKVKANEVQPIWVTVDVPKDLKPGTYRITITLFADNSNQSKVTADLKVWDFELPDRTYIKTCFWYGTYQLSGYYPEMKDVWETEKKFLKMALDHKITPVSNQIAYLGNDLVRISFDEVNKKYNFDFSAMGKRLNFIFNSNERKGNFLDVSAGVFGEAISFMVTTKNGKTKKTFKPFTAESEDFIIQYLYAWKNFLKENNWAQYAYISSVDEPKEDKWETVKWLYQLVKKHIPQWKTFSAVNSQPSFYGLKNDVDIIVPGFFANFNLINLKDFQAFQKEGRELWGYVCYKTSCIDFQSIDHRIWTWICWKYNLKGFLYWDIFSWSQGGTPANNKAMFVRNFKDRWPYKAKWEPGDFSRGVAGDGYLIYPSPEGEPWSSIRLENIRDGIEDYEYFYLLNECLSKLKEKGNKYRNLIKQAESLLEIGPEIINEPDEYTQDFKKLLERRDKIGNLLEDIMSVLKR